MKVRVSRNSFLMAVGGGLAIVAMANIGLPPVIKNRFVVVEMESAWLKMGPMQEGVLKMSRASYANCELRWSRVRSRS